MSKPLKMNQMKFQALNEFVQIEPIQEEQKRGNVPIAEVTKGKSPKGRVLSVGEGRFLADGTFIKSPVKVGDLIVYNPFMVGYELKDDQGKITMIISSNAIYGKYNK